MHAIVLRMRHVDASSEGCLSLPRCSPCSQMQTCACYLRCDCEPSPWQQGWFGTHLGKQTALPAQCKARSDAHAVHTVHYYTLNKLYKCS